MIMIWHYRNGINQNRPLRHLLGKLHCLSRERTCRYENTLGCTFASKRTGKLLNHRSSDRLVLGVSFRLKIDFIKTKWVLIDYAIKSFIATPTGPFSDSALCTAVTHFHNQLQNKLFKKGR